MWFKVDDRLPEHPKVRKLGRDQVVAIGLWTLCGAWCGNFAQNGFVPRAIARRFAADSRTFSRATRALVDAGLWIECAQNGEPGWRFHDWHDYQLTADQRRSRAEAGRRGGLRSGEVRRTKREASASADGGNDEASALKQNEAKRSPEPEPVPVPLATDVASEAPRKRGAARTRATRIPEDFAVTHEMAAWARAECPDADGRAETAKFIDYWRGKAGQDATKVDWPSTWRNWMRRAQESAHGPPRQRAVNGHRPTADDKIAALQAMKSRPYALPAGGDP